MSPSNWDVMNANSKTPIFSWTHHFWYLLVEHDVLFPQRYKLLFLNVLTTKSHTYHKLPTEKIVDAHSKVVGNSQKHQLKVLGLPKCKTWLLFFNFLCNFLNSTTQVLPYLLISKNYIQVTLTFEILNSWKSLHPTVNISKVISKVGSLVSECSFFIVTCEIL